jgi:flagellar L-ring protein precursor FlgH
MKHHTHSLILVLVAACACAGALYAQNPQPRPGSIYDPQAGPFGLVANKTAGRPGDLLTIEIEENQDLKNEESSDLKRETSLKAKLTNFDIKPNAFSVLPALDGSSSDALKGTANYSKKGKFTARVTAVVVDVLPNGNLVVNGRREIRIDQETKLIEFSGIVRRWDVRADNTIPSELVAEAKVSYTGHGPLTEQSTRRGVGKWLHDVFLWVWPF